MRRRASSAASTMRRRDTRRSSTRARRSAFRRSLSIASDDAAAAACDELGARVQRGVVDDRRHAAPVLLDRGPRAPRSGLGQRDGVAAPRRRRPRGRAASRRSPPSGRPGSRPASRAPARSARRAGPAARGRSCTARVYERVERGDHEHRRGRGQRQQHEAEAGPERPRAEVVDRAQPADALHAEAEDLRQQRQRHERDEAQAGDQQRLGGQQGDHPPQGAVGEDVERAPPRVARRRRRRPARAGCGCPGSGWPRGGRAARAAGRRPRRRAAAAARSRRRSARRRGRARAPRALRGSRSGR